VGQKTEKGKGHGGITGITFHLLTPGALDLKMGGKARSRLGRTKAPGNSPSDQKGEGVGKNEREKPPSKLGGGEKVMGVYSRGWGRLKKTFQVRGGGVKKNRS